MKSRLEEDLRIGDYEGSVLNRVMIDVFKPKLCHEKDILVAAFPVKSRETAQYLSLYLSEGPFNFLNSEASSSPDRDGNYILLVELDRNREAFTTLDQILQYINQLAHTADWHFKTLDTPSYVAWGREHFNRWVPQNPEEFLNREAADENDTSADADPDADAPSQTTPAQPQAESSPKQASNINYRLMAKIIERQITRSNLIFIKEFQKQLKKIIKDNRLILQQFKELKSDQHYLYKQLELHQRREKLGLLREQQDFKRIRDLQDRLSNMIIDRTESSGASPQRIDARAVGVEEIAHIDSQQPEAEFESAAAEAPPGDDLNPTSEENLPQPGETLYEPAPPMVSDSSDAWEAVDSSIPEAAFTAAPDPVENVLTAERGPEASGAADVIEKLPESPIPAKKIDSGTSAKIVPPDAHDDSPARTEDIPEGSTTSGKPEPPAPMIAADPLSRLFSRGMAASDRKDYHTAIEHFTKITELAPDEPRGHYNLAVLYYRLKDYDTAHTYARQALASGAQAAQRILDKIETQPSDLERQSLEPVAGGRDSGGAPPETAAADPPQPESQPESLQKAAVEAPPPGGEDEPAGSEAAAAEIEAAILGDNDTLPTFPVLTGMDIDASAADDAQGSGRFDYMDTMTMSNMDLSPVDTDDGDWQDENVFELSEPAVETASEGFAELPPETSPESETSQGADWAALEAVMTAGEAEPESAPTTEAPQPALETAPEGTATPADADTSESASTEATPPVAAATGDVVSPVSGAVAAEAAPPAAEPAQKVPEPALPVEENAEDFFNLGMAASAQKDHRQAATHFHKFVELAPEEPRGYYNLAILYYRLKKYETARDQAQRALSLGAKAARKILAKIDKKTGAGGTAASSADKTAPGSALQQALKPPSGTMQPGVSLEDAGEEDTVIWDADELEEELDTEEVDLENFATPYGSSDDVIFFGSSKVEADNRGVIQPAGKQSPAPESAFDDAPARAPGKPKPSEAAAPKAPSAEKAPVDSEVERFFTLGQKAADQKEYLKAIQHFTKVTQLAAEDPRGYYNLAIVSYRLKFYETAREHAKRALELGAAAAQRIIDKIDAQQATV